MRYRKTFQYSVGDAHILRDINEHWEIHVNELSILRWRCRKHTTGSISRRRQIIIFQYSVGDARGPPLCVTCRRLTRPFNTPLEMRAAIAVETPADPRAEAFNTPLEMPLTHAMSPFLTAASTFNTPLEMHPDVSCSHEPRLCAETFNTPLEMPSFSPRDEASQRPTQSFNTPLEMRWLTSTAR